MAHLIPSYTCICKALVNAGILQLRPHSPMPASGKTTVRRQSAQCHDFVRPVTGEHITALSMHTLYSACRPLSRSACHPPGQRELSAVHVRGDVPLQSAQASLLDDVGVPDKLLQTPWHKSCRMGYDATTPLNVAIIKF